MLRIPAIRLRFFPLLLLPLIVLWKIDGLTYIGDMHHMQTKGAKEQPSGRQLFASEEHHDTVFSVENVKYKWTSIHANVLEEETGRYMEVLAFLEGKGL